MIQNPMVSNDETVKQTVQNENNTNLGSNELLAIEFKDSIGMPEKKVKSRHISKLAQKIYTEDIEIENFDEYIKKYIKDGEEITETDFAISIKSCIDYPNQQNREKIAQILLKHYLFGKFPPINPNLLPFIVKRVLQKIPKNYYFVKNESNLIEITKSAKTALDGCIFFNASINYVYLFYDRQLDKDISSNIISVKPSISENINNLSLAKTELIPQIQGDNKIFYMQINEEQYVQRSTEKSIIKEESIIKKKSIIKEKCQNDIIEKLLKQMNNLEPLENYKIRILFGVNSHNYKNGGLLEQNINHKFNISDIVIYNNKYAIITKKNKNQYILLDSNNETNTVTNKDVMLYKVPEKIFYVFLYPKDMTTETLEKYITEIINKDNE